MTATVTAASSRQTQRRAHDLGDTAQHQPAQGDGAGGQHGVMDHHPGAQPGGDAGPLPRRHRHDERPPATEDQQDADRAERPAHPGHADTTIAETHLVCSTPGRFGAIRRAG